jgi:hypothetical protein
MNDLDPKIFTLTRNNPISLPLLPAGGKKLLPAGGKKRKKEERKKVCWFSVKWRNRGRKIR